MLHATLATPDLVRNLIRSDAIRRSEVSVADGAAARRLLALKYDKTAIAISLVSMY